MISTEVQSGECFEHKKLITALIVMGIGCSDRVNNCGAVLSMARRRYLSTAKPIHTDNDMRIGVNTMILPGVTFDNCVVGVVPAGKIKDIEVDTLQ